MGMMYDHKETLADALAPWNEYIEGQKVRREQMETRPLAQFWAIPDPTTLLVVFGNEWGVTSQKLHFPTKAAAEAAKYGMEGKYLLLYAWFYEGHV